MTPEKREALHGQTVHTHPWVPSLEALPSHFLGPLLSLCHTNDSKPHLHPQLRVPTMGRGLRWNKMKLGSKYHGESKS